MIARLARPLFLAALLAFSLVPFYWMVVASVKPGDAQLTIGNPWWFEGFEVTGYTGLVADSVFRDWMLNTLLVLVAILVIISIIFFQVMAGFFVPWAGHILGPLIVWLAKRGDSPEIDEHGKESLNFQISMLIYNVIAGLLCILE